MEWAGVDFLARIGLSSRGSRRAASVSPIKLAGSDTDPQTGLVVALSSETALAKKDNPEGLKIKYWRHLPYGRSLEQNLIEIKTAPVPDKKGHVALDEVWVQSRLVFSAARGDDAEDPETKKKIQRVLEVANRLNTGLREGFPVRDTAKIFDECRLDKSIGEDIVIRGLDKKGGFSFSLSPHFSKAMAPGSSETLEFSKADINDLKAAMGFRINSLEPDKNFTGTRTVSGADPQSGVVFESGVRVKETKNRLDMEMYIDPVDAPEGTDPQAIPDLVRLSFVRKGADSFELKRASFMDRDFKVNDTKSVLALTGFAQACNRDLAEWKFPAFMNHAAEYNLLDKINSFGRPKPLKEGGEFLYGSLHGCGSEKKIENFGDQIGIAAMFLHRGTKADGTVSTVGVAVDFPFASGGPNSNYDGAVPNYLPFMKDIKCFVITHGHFDHKGGVAFYAAKGLLAGKIIYCTDRDKRALKKDMVNMGVPRHLQPIVRPLKNEGAFPVLDDEGNTRMWVQHSPNATKHSALTTPYIVTGCMNDEHYNHSALVYGDANGLSKRAIDFANDKNKKLHEVATELGHTVTLDKLPKKLIALHDTTAVRYDGHAPRAEEVEDNLSTVFSWFPKKGVLAAPITTNNAEYTALLNVAHRKERDITAVGGNAEFTLSTMNLFGVLPDYDLSEVRIDPLEELQKPEEERLIPKDVLDVYMESLKEAAEQCGTDLDDCDLNVLKKEHKKGLKEYIEKLPPSKRKHEKNAEFYMLKSLQKYGAVRFDNDINGYFMWKAVTERDSVASIRATRTSQFARDFRTDPSALMIFVTGTQGNGEEKFSTMQKFVNFFSLLDTDERVRNTGFKINAQDYIAVISQPAIPGNRDSQERMINDLVKARDITVVGAYLNGFKVYNPKENRDHILNQLNKLGWKYESDAEGSIRVYGRPIHIHGHGFAQDMVEMARSVNASLHVPHHIPDLDSQETFRELMDKEGLTRPDDRSDDFKFYAMDSKQDSKDKEFKCVAHIDPSYILVRMARRYGQFFGGTLEWQEARLLRREGNNRTDGLMSRSDGDGVYRKMTARMEWEHMTSPEKADMERYRKLGPSDVERHEGYRKPRSRPIWTMPLPEAK